ncbi:hypothetical protein LTR48_003501, partial [Friedmanniomyces endolithicus]
MKDFGTLLALPAGLLSVILAAQVGAQELAWAGAPPRALEQDNVYRRQDLEILQQPARQAPAGVRKMSDDEGEKFFFHYWDLGDDLAHPNASDTLFPASRPLAAHRNNSRTPLALFGRSIFARDFQCPADTSSCSAAGNADLCCPTGQDCATVSGRCVFYGTATTVVTLSTTSPSPVVSSTTTIDPAPYTTQQPPVVVTPVQPSVLVSGYTTTVTVTESASGGVTTIVSPTTVIIAPAATITSETSVSTASQPSSTCN